MAIRAVRRPENIAAVAHVLSIDQQEDAAMDDGFVADPSKMANVSSKGANGRPEDLAAIRDNAPFRTAEQPAWFALFDAVARAKAEELAAGSLGDVNCVQLIAQPNFYRAKLVTIRGTVRRVTAERPAANDLAIESYHRLVIQPAGGDPTPIFAYCLSIPDDFPRGDTVSVEATVTGFFFKNLSYQSEGGPAIAPVLVAKGISAAQRSHAREVAAAATPDVNTGADAGTLVQLLENATSVDAEFKNLMRLAGWNTERWDAFGDDRPLTDAEREELLPLLHRLRSFDAASLDAWSRKASSPAELIANSQQYRGELIRLSGRVRRVAVRNLAANEAARFEMPSYYECEMDLDSGAQAIVFATRVPKDWRLDESIDEPAVAAAVYLKRGPLGDNNSPSVWAAARHIAWLPTQVNEPIVSFGESLLGEVGMDVGLLDSIRNHLPIRPEEREAFFAMLGAAGRGGANQLIRFAERDLETVQQTWSREVSSADKSRSALAREVVTRAQKGLYSVAPLFNDPDSQVGRLVSIEGIVRRVVRVEVGETPDGKPSDVQGRFGIDHYFEMDVFTDDSQNRPIIVCVRELPVDFPTGTGLTEPIRVAGFFFKSWHYFPHRAARTSAAEDAAAQIDAARGLISPLIIGRAPVVLSTEEKPGTLTGPIGVGLFLIALASTWGLVWWYSREDRGFHERTLAPRFSLPAGQSLDDLNLTDAAGFPEPPSHAGPR